MNSEEICRKALQEIYDFSRKNPGCGYSCGTMAKKALDACEAPEQSPPKGGDILIENPVDKSKGT